MFNVTGSDDRRHPISQHHEEAIHAIQIPCKLGDHVLLEFFLKRVEILKLKEKEKEILSSSEPGRENILGDSVAWSIMRSDLRTSI